ncbi:MAG: radical SAM protein [bacterium]
MSEKISTVFTIYPIEIPEIKFLPDQDFILLQLPMRYMPMMPNGLGYVHNILKRTRIRFQTVDLNIIFYHLYHSKRILNRLEKIVTPSGYVMKDDPWDNTNCDEWNKLEVIEHFRPEIKKIVNSLIKAHPKIIGLSLNGTNLSISREVVNEIRKTMPEVIVIVGGYDCVYPKVGPKKFSEFDYMIINEAEMTLSPLVKALLVGEKPKNLPGIISRYDSPDRVWESAPLFQDLDSIDFPRYEWTEINLYHTYDSKYLVPIVANRGCRWSKCRFCCECFHWRKRDPKKVVDEIEWFAEQRFTSFHFNESDFNCDQDTTFELCNEIIRRKLKISFAAAGFRIDRRNTREFFDHLHAAGFTSLQLGVDGWTNHTLRLQRKGYTMEIVEQNLRDCYEAGIFVSVNIVIGVPGETEEDVEESIDNMLKNKEYIDVVGTIEPLILGHGSEYYKNPQLYNIRFKDKKQDIYEKYPDAIPSELWYSVDPYIDHEVRIDRLKRITLALWNGGIYIGAYAKQSIERKIKKAIALEPELEKALSLEPENRRIIVLNHYSFGSNYEREGELEKAKEKFEETINFAKEIPSFANRNRFIGGAHFHLGSIYQKMGDEEKAKHHFEECLRFIPDHRKAKENLTNRERS